jgi:hypothetical protein
MTRSSPCRNKKGQYAECGHLQKDGRCRDSNGRFVRCDRTSTRTSSTRSRSRTPSPKKSKSPSKSRSPKKIAPVEQSSLLSLLGSWF